MPSYAVSIQSVILCGGSGTRLWPMSREQYPKRLLALAGNDTPLQATARRVDKSLAIADGKLLRDEAQAPRLC